MGVLVEVLVLVGVLVDVGVALGGTGDGVNELVAVGVKEGIRLGVEEDVAVCVAVGIVLPVCVGITAVGIDVDVVTNVGMKDVAVGVGAPIRT